MKDQLTPQFREEELNNHALRIYTTIDPDLQRAAAEAVDVGMKLVDEQVIKRRTHKIKVGTGKGSEDRREGRNRADAASRAGCARSA